MEVQAAGEDVRAGEAFEGEVGAVGAAADGLDLRLDTRHLHSLNGLLDHKIVRFHLLAHVVVLILKHQGRSTLTILRIDEIDHLAHQDLLGLELGAVVITDDVGDVGFFDGAVEGNQVEEALIALSVFRALVHREQTAEFVPLESMEAASKVILNIVTLYAE